VSSTVLAVLVGLPFGVGLGFILGYSWVHWEERKRLEEDDQADEERRGKT